MHPFPLCTACFGLGVAIPFSGTLFSAEPVLRRVTEVPLEEPVDTFTKTVR